MINVLFFARIRDAVGNSELTLELPNEIRNIAQFTQYLVHQHGVCSGILDQPNVLVAVNQEFASAQTTIQDGDEIAYFPPVTGG